ncbi:hypothetical protein AAC387_Pa12g1232 [Persea americana]
MDGVNLGGAEHPRLVLISNSLNGGERDTYVELLEELKDIFAWDYKEMPGLDPSVTVHCLNIRPKYGPHKQPKRKFAPDHTEKIEAEVHKLLRLGFIREDRHPDWLANVVPVPKKNGEIRVCIDYRDLNMACPKDDFPLTKIMVDNSCGFERMTFMDDFSGHNHIKMNLSDERHTSFRTHLKIYYYTIMPSGLKNAGATYQREMMKSSRTYSTKRWRAMWMI